MLFVCGGSKLVKGVKFIVSRLYIPCTPFSVITSRAVHSAAEKRRKKGMDA
jgi:hypothetical protein